MPEGKQGSKAAMIFATAYLVVMPIINHYLKIGLAIDEIIKIAAASVAIWSPIFASIIIDKIKGAEGEK